MLTKDQLKLQAKILGWFYSEIRMPHRYLSRPIRLSQFRSLPISQLMTRLRPSLINGGSGSSTDWKSREREKNPDEWFSIKHRQIPTLNIVATEYIQSISTTSARMPFRYGIRVVNTFNFTNQYSKCLFETETKKNEWLCRKAIRKSGRSSLTGEWQNRHEFLLLWLCQAK
jgi:hypothetical protein